MPLCPPAAAGATQKRAEPSVRRALSSNGGAARYRTIFCCFASRGPRPLAPRPHREGGSPSSVLLIQQEVSRVRFFFRLLLFVREFELLQLFAGSGSERSRNLRGSRNSFSLTGNHHKLSDVVATKPSRLRETERNNTVEAGCCNLL